MALARFARRPVGSEAAPHSSILMTAPVLFMRYTSAGACCPASTMRAGRSKTKSAMGLPISTTIPIRSLALATPSAPRPASASAARSALATAMLITPPYGMPVALSAMMVVRGASTTVAAFVTTVMSMSVVVPDGTRIAALSLPLTVSTFEPGEMTTAGDPGSTTMVSGASTVKNAPRRYAWIV